MVDELRSLKANLEETLEEFRRQFFGVSSEKTSVKIQPAEETDSRDTKIIPVSSHTRTRKPKAT